MILASGLGLTAHGVLLFVGPTYGHSEFFLAALFPAVLVLVGPALVAGWIARGGGRLGQILGALVGWLYGGALLVSILPAPWTGQLPHTNGADVYTEAAMIAVTAGFLLGALLLTVATARRVLGP